MHPLTEVRLYRIGLHVASGTRLPFAARCKIAVGFGGIWNWRFAVCTTCPSDGRARRAGRPRRILSIFSRPGLDRPHRVRTIVSERAYCALLHRTTK